MLAPGITPHSLYSGMAVVMLGAVSLALVEALMLKMLSFDD